jgi:predicted dehydrogenase
MRMLGKWLGAQRSPGVDKWCRVDLALPGGVTGRSTNSMVASEHSFTLRVVGTTGEAFAHNFIKPHDRVTISTAGGSRVERLGTRPSYTYQLEAFAADVLDGASPPLDSGDAVENMSYVDAAYRAAGMAPR